jgi:hypothetical protein
MPTPAHRGRPTFHWHVPSPTSPQRGSHAHRWPTGQLPTPLFASIPNHRRVMPLDDATAHHDSRI